jgi:hypothetical protein
MTDGSACRSCFFGTPFSFPGAVEIRLGCATGSVDASRGWDHWDYTEHRDSSRSSGGGQVRAPAPPGEDQDGSIARLWINTTELFPVRISGSSAEPLNLPLASAGVGAVVLPLPLALCLVQRGGVTLHKGIPWRHRTELFSLSVCTGMTGADVCRKPWLDPSAKSLIRRHRPRLSRMVRNHTVVELMVLRRAIRAAQEVLGAWSERR